MLITSLQNSYIKNLASLKQKKYRDEAKLFLIEGEDIVNEANKFNLIKTILYVDKPPFYKEGIEYIEVTNEIIKKLSTQVTQCGYIAVCNFLENFEKGKRVICLDGVQDPGNGGTLLRSALAFGFDEMLISNDSFDIYNEKFIRASKGSIFHLNIKRCNLKEELNRRKEEEYQIISTSVSDNSVSYQNLNVSNRLCLVVGNEGQGISKEIFALSNDIVHINMSNKMESLNVGVAGSIIMSYIYSK